MSRTLYVTDLDGTLLGADGRLSATSSRMLREVIARGVLVTCATARSWTSVQRVLGDFRFDLPVVLYNGIFTYDAARDVTLDRNSLDPATTQTSLDVLKEFGMPPLVYGLDGSSERVSWVTGLETAVLRRFWADRPDDPRNSPRRGWSDLPTEGVFNLAAIGSQVEIDPVATELRARVGHVAEVNVQRDTYHPQDIWLEVAPVGVTKGRAVAALADRLRADRVVVFGDNVNDLPMFQVADESYAMAHAEASVRAAATGVLDDALDAVARWIAANATAAAAP